MQAPLQGLRMQGWKSCYRPWTRQRLLLHLHRLQSGERAAPCAVLQCKHAQHCHVKHRPSICQSSHRIGSGSFSVSIRSTAM